MPPKKTDGVRGGRKKKRKISQILLRSTLTNGSHGENVE